MAWTAQGTRRLRAPIGSLYLLPVHQKQQAAAAAAVVELPAQDTKEGSGMPFIILWIQPQ